MHHSPWRWAAKFIFREGLLLGKTFYKISRQTGRNRVMNLALPMVEEFRQESIATRRMLERVPQDKFTWRPHVKSMSLIMLASHLAHIPEWANLILTQGEYVIPEKYEPVLYDNVKDMVAAFDRSVAASAGLMEKADDVSLLQTWRLLAGDNVIFALPRAAVLRTMVMNHAVHHRGQLSVYLRLLGVPVPAVYGPTADEQ
jgi:uncharacterized damage-inducible protein DinB